METVQEYQIIPRRFRPKRFGEVVGHEAITTTLKNALDHKKLGQAYLFCGMRGCGKTTLARLFAKALNCHQLSEEKEPCNSCPSCTEISEGSSLDIIEIDGASNRGIEDIRRLTETVGYAPQKGKFKIYLIDEVHMLTKEAFNALLKTLEEPPSHVKFFFATTEPHRVPPTIISRCQRFNLGRIPEKHLVEKLKRISQELSVEIEEKALVQIGELAEGSLRDAESLLDQLICYGKSPITGELTREVFGLIANEHLTEIDEVIASQNLEGAMAMGDRLYDSGRDVGAILDSLLDHFRNHLENKGPFDQRQCLNLLETLLDWQKQMAKTPFKRVHLQMLMASLVKSARALSLDQLIERLLKLEEGKEVQQQVAPPKPLEEEIVQPQPVEKVENTHQHPAQKYETLLRFAAVELEGTIKNG